MTPPEDSGPWLSRLGPEEWLKAAIGELGRAERAFAQRDLTRGIAGSKRAAGMALNGALAVVPNERWGRSYVEHLKALSQEEHVPAEVSSAAALLAELAPARGDVVGITTRGRIDEWLEAARTVMAHAYAVVHGSAGRRR
ncbi:MAG TPA: hypothetical protein VM686_02615 [Polyangiaceae bacterium]|jgi:HEPN domain-containing protein|nr:hypothetical protein [Polyangiaceae bacterium]